MVGGSRCTRVPVIPETGLVSDLRFLRSSARLCSSPRSPRPQPAVGSSGAGNLARQQHVGSPVQRSGTARLSERPELPAPNPIIPDDVPPHHHPAWPRARARTPAEISCQGPCVLDDYGATSSGDPVPVPRAHPAASRIRPRPSLLWRQGSPGGSQSGPARPAPGHESRTWPSACRREAPTMSPSPMYRRGRRVAASAAAPPRTSAQAAAAEADISTSGRASSPRRRAAAAARTPAPPGPTNLPRAAGSSGSNTSKMTKTVLLD